MAYKITERLLTPNKYSRPQIKINKIKALVIHWVANPNSSASANVNYFERRKNGITGFGSAHEVIDLNGNIIKCLPDDEMGYHVGSKTYTKSALKNLGDYPNNCSYGIECTHIDWDGKMTDETYNTLVKRCADLCKEFNLNPLDDLWLHYEVVGWKDCHRFFVNNPNEWKLFKKRVDSKLNGGGVLQLEDFQWNMLEEALREFYDEGILNSDEWVVKTQNRELTTSELSFLNTIILKRNLLNK